MEKINKGLGKRKHREERGVGGKEINEVLLVRGGSKGGVVFRGGRRAWRGSKWSAIHQELPPPANPITPNHLAHQQMKSLIVHEVTPTNQQPP